MPFEGCGGDGNIYKGIADIMNTCVTAITNTTALIEALYHGDWSSICDANSSSLAVCGGMCTLYNNTWDWNSTVRQEFVPFSAPLAINIPPPLAPRNETFTHLNWCSGQNMHFDIGMSGSQIYWNIIGGKTNNIYEFAGTDSNIMMRYKRVRCDIYGKIPLNTLKGL